MHKNFENWKSLGFFVIFGVNLRHFHLKKTGTNSSEKATGQHILSLLTLSNVPIYKVRQKFEKIDNFVIFGVNVGQFHSLIW